MATSQAQSVSQHSDHPFGERYVHLVQSLPQVRRVLLEQTMSGPRLWTVIVAEPFDDSQRDPVYEAELRAMEEYPAVVMNFRLVNLSEFPAESHPSLLPADAEVLLRR